MALFVLIITVPGVARALLGAGCTAFAALGGDPPAAGISGEEFLFWR